MRRALALALLVLLARAAFLVDAARRASVSYDEVEYVYGGFRAWTAFDLSISPHPPVVKWLCGWSVWLAGAEQVFEEPRPPLGTVRTAWPQARHFVHRNAVPPERILLAARLPAIGMWVALGLVLFAWSRALHGARGGWVTLALVCTCPHLMGHGWFVTSDVPLVTFACLALWGVSRATDARGAALAGAAAGLALASRQAGLVLVVLLPALAGLARPGWRAWGRGTAAGALAALGTLTLAYGVVWLPHYWGGLGTFHATYFGDVGHDLYFLAGETSERGWWGYFPLVAAIKTSPWRLALLGAVVVGLMRRRPSREEAVPAIAAVVVFGLAMLSGVNYALRHVLLCWPLMYVVAGRLAGRWALVAVALVVVGDAVEQGRLHPYYQAYASPVVGGAARVHEWVADGNLDSGQSLADLARWQRTEEAGPVWLAYFGQGEPAAYGVRYRLLPLAWDRDGLLAGEETRGWPARIAVSVHTLRTYGGLYGWLEGRRPVAQPGYGMHVYDCRREDLPYLALVYAHGAADGSRAAPVRQRYLDRAVMLLRATPRAERARARTWIDAWLRSRAATRAMFEEAVRRAG